MSVHMTPSTQKVSHATEKVPDLPGRFIVFAPQVGRGTYSPPTCSAHANGGAARVKSAFSRFSLAARHRFFGQAPKKWGRKAGQGNDHLPT